MSVDLYGILTQSELPRYSCARETTADQERDLLFSSGQRDSLLLALTFLLPFELGLDVIKPIRPQSKQAVGEHLTLCRRICRWLFRVFHCEPTDNERVPP
jgi:hypothetical protein